MKTKRLSLMVLVLGVMLALGASQAFAQTRPEYIPLGGGVKGVLYRPDSNPSPNVAVIIIHRTANYLQHAGCTQLSQRGLMVLCMNSRFDNNEALVEWELIALDVKRGVDYLKNTQKISKVILFGHSGGGRHIRAQAAAGNWRFPDNESLIIARGGGSQAGGGSGANLFVMDTDILCCTVKPQKLLKNDGSIVTEIVRSVRLPDPTRKEGNETFDDGTKNLTVTAFLSANAIRATDSMDYKQIDWCSTNNSTPCALQNITVPLLVTSMGAHYFHLDAEQFYENYSASKDKDNVVFAGLVHGITPCNNCPGGPYNNQVTNYWNYLFDWIKTRFGT
jgi:hypothetical protein